MRSRSFSTCLAVAAVLGLAAGCGSDPAPGTDDSGTDVPASTDVPTTPDVPAAPDVPTTPDVPTIPDVPETPDVPTTPDVPETPDVPTTPDVPEPVDGGPMCAPGGSPCDGRCVNFANDRAHCGACGMACSMGQVCAAGVCTVECVTGQTNCGGSCRDTQTDRAHCGACGMACATGQVCTAGACVVECLAGQTSCGGQCFNLQIEANHCGACGMACAAGQVCRAGACVEGCLAGLSDCQGACLNVQTSASHCGRCGNACAAGTYCAAGMCVADRCVGVSCPASDPCHTVNPCDRATGMCRPALDVTVSAMGASALVGVRGCTMGYTAPQCSFQPYDTGGNFAAQANNGGVAAVASGALPTDAPIHRPAFANDGRYGNGASWIPNAAGSWLKLDLGRSIAIDTIAFGRDRVGGVTDRPAGRYTVYVAATEAAYANGNDADDATEYRRVFDSSAVMGRGESIPTGQTVTARFAPVLGRFVKIVFTTDGVGIDEVEVRGCDPSTTTCPGLPTGNGMACNDGLVSTSTDVCADGACVGTACATGLADCDGNRTNACEVDTRTSGQHCGACGNVCAQGLFCVAGACTPPRSCADLLARNPATMSGTYAIDPDGAGGVAPFTAVCDMTTDGGGWTLGLLKNSAHAGNYGDFGAVNTGLTALANTPEAASASSTGMAGWVNLNTFPYTTLRLAAYRTGARTYLSNAIRRTDLRIAFGQPGYLLYNDPSGYYWCGGPASYTDEGVGQVNRPTGAPADCKNHGSLGSGWDFSQSDGANAGLTLCGADRSNWMSGTYAGGAQYSYPAPGAAYAIWVR